MKNLSIEDLKKDKKRAIRNLKIVLTTNKKIYMAVSHISKTGLSRTVKLKAIYKNNLVSLDYAASLLLDEKFDPKNGGVIIKGHGMDIGDNLIARLSSILYGKSDNLKQSWI